GGHGHALAVLPAVRGGLVADAVPAAGGPEHASVTAALAAGEHSLMRGLLMLMLVIWSCWGLADTPVWGKLRDADLYLNTEREASLTMRWHTGWQADANHERRYLLDGHARLMHQIDVGASQSRGVRQFALGPGDGAHRLSVPGYSFRAWEIELPGYVHPLYE